MKTIRQALRNGFWRGGIALSLAYLLLLQSLLGGLAQGAMAAASTAPGHVICTSRGLVVLDPTADPDSPHKAALDWHCATICHLASAGASPDPAAQTAAISAPLRQGIAVAYVPAEIAQSAFKGLIPEARAPPVSI